MTQKSGWLYTVFGSHIWKEAQKEDLKNLKIARDESGVGGDDGTVSHTKQRYLS